MSAFAENMRRIRFERHMTQEEFADFLGTTKQNISRYESGTVSPKITTASRIAQKLGISLSALNGDLDSDNAASQGSTHMEDETRIVSGAMDKLPKEQRQQILAVIRAMFANNPDLFK